MGVRGPSFIAMNIRGTPGNNVGFSFAIALSAISTSNRGNSTSFAAFIIPKSITSVPNEWKNGSAATSRPPPSHDLEPRDRLARVRDEVQCESIAPFDSPVVPPV